MRFEWNLGESPEQFIENIGGALLDFEEGCLQDNYLVGTEGFILEEGILGIKDGNLNAFNIEFPSGIVMITERYLNTNSSGHLAVFSNEDTIWDEWYGFVDAIGRDYDE